MALLSGGILPIERRDTRFHGVVSVVDLWASFAFLAHALGALDHHRHITASQSPASSSSSSRHFRTEFFSGGEDSLATLAPAVLPLDSPFLFPNLYKATADAAAGAPLAGEAIGSTAHGAPLGGSKTSLGSSSTGLDEVEAEVENEVYKLLFGGDEHLAGIMSIPTRRQEVVLQPLNEHSTGVCKAGGGLGRKKAPLLSRGRSDAEAQEKKNPFHPACAAGIIVWPHKLLVGFPGDGRHVAWPVRRSSSVEKGSLDRLAPLPRQGRALNDSTAFASSQLIADSPPPALPLPEVRAPPGNRRSGSSPLLPRRRCGHRAA